MHHSESIILSKRPLGEADLIISFFSQSEGKVKGVARYAKRSKRRFGGVLETGYIVDIHYASSPGADLLKISQASLVAPIVHAGPSLANTSALWLALELADRFLPDHNPSEEKYQLLRRFVLALHEGRVNRGALVFFLLRWIALCGYMPDLNSCVKCGLRKEGLRRFSAGLGGLLCEDCGPSAGLDYQFKKGDVPILKRIVSGDVKSDIKDQSFEDLLKFVFHYSMVLLGRPLKLESYLPMLMDMR